MACNPAVQGWCIPSRWGMGDSAGSPLVQGRCIPGRLRGVGDQPSPPFVQGWCIPGLRGRARACRRSRWSTSVHPHAYGADRPVKSLIALGKASSPGYGADRPVKSLMSRGRASSPGCGADAQVTYNSTRIRLHPRAYGADTSHVRSMPVLPASCPGGADRVAVPIALGRGASSPGGRGGCLVTWRVVLITASSVLVVGYRVVAAVAPVESERQVSLIVRVYKFGCLPDALRTRSCAARRCPTVLRAGEGLRTATLGFRTVSEPALAGSH